MVFKFLSGHDFVTESKGNNLKSIKEELQFLRSAHHLMLIDISMKLHEDSLNGFQVIEPIHFVTESKGNNSKSKKSRVMVLALCMPPVDIYIKFREDSLNGFQDIELTRV